jgi:hypothetical protein
LRKASNWEPGFQLEEGLRTLVPSPLSV